MKQIQTVEWEKEFDEKTDMNYGEWVVELSIGGDYWLDTEKIKQFIKEILSNYENNVSNVLPGIIQADDKNPYILNLFWQNGSWVARYSRYDKEMIVEVLRWASGNTIHEALRELGMKKGDKS